jgi:hypothetical protein
VAESAGVCSATPELRISNAAAQTRIVSKAQNSAGFPQICAILQRDNSRRHFGVRVLPPQPRSLVSVGYVQVAELCAGGAVSERTVRAVDRGPDLRQRLVRIRHAIEKERVR